MKSISTNLNAHLAGEVSTLATCWKITRTDDQVFGFTDHDSDLIVSAVTYLAAFGYTASAVETSGDFGVDNLEIEGIINASVITEADLMAGVWDYATVEIFMVNYNAIADGVLKQRKGRLGEVRMRTSRFMAELRGLVQHLSQTIGEVYSPTCRADLFDARCGLAAATYKVTGTVTHVTDNATFRDTGRTEADDYFGGGKITWTSGLNNGRSMEIKTHVSSTDAFTLVLPMVQNIQVGDTYDMWPGCRKRVSDCRTKFLSNNIVNFRGEPFVAGIDAMTRGPT